MPPLQPPRETPLHTPARASATNSKSRAMTRPFALHCARVSVDFLIHSGSIDETRHCAQQLNRLNRLGDMVLVAGGEGAQAVFPTRICREGDGRNMPAEQFLPRAQFLHQRVAVFPRHADVGDEYVWPPLVTGGQRLRR